MLQWLDPWLRRVHPKHQLEHTALWDHVHVQSVFKWHIDLLTYLGTSPISTICPYDYLINNNSAHAYCGVSSLLPQVEWLSKKHSQATLPIPISVRDERGWIVGTTSCVSPANLWLVERENDELQGQQGFNYRVDTARAYQAASWITLKKSS
jgi:hypothetical protein